MKDELLSVHEHPDIALKLTNEVSAVLAYWDSEEVCRFANGAYYEWFGYRKEHMINRMTLRELLGPVYSLNKPYIDGALTGQQQTFERNIPTPFGEVRQALVNYFPREENGRITGFFVQAVDVSYAKRLEQQLRESNERVSEQNERLMNFAHIVSHNLKSYANNIQGLIKIFGSSTDETEKLTVLNYLQNVSASFQETIDHLSQVAEVHSQKRIGIKELVVEDFVGRILQLLQAQIQENNTTVRLNVSENLVCKSNPAYLESIIINLLTNAIRYRHPGREALIEIDFHGNEGHLHFSVKDNGLGLDVDKHGDHLFGMYKTFHGNIDAKGLGLFITKMQVDALGGSIAVKGSPGNGCCFSVSLPEVAL